MAAERVPHRPTGRLHGDGGSALLLAPAGVLVVVALAALASDTTLVHLRRHELAGVAAAAAGDAVAHGLDERALRSGRGITLDPARVGAVVAASVAAHGLDGELAGPPRVELGPAGQVTVELAADVAYLFAPAVSAIRGTRVTASATAVSEQR